MRIAAHVPDLMDRSKIATLGDVTFVADPAELPDVAAASSADVVVVDLSRAGVLDVLSRIDAHTIGFGRHTSTELLEEARAAGCDEVLARSEFFARVQRGSLAPRGS